MPWSSGCGAACVQASLPADLEVWLVVSDELLTGQLRSFSRTISAPEWRLSKGLYGLSVSGWNWERHLDSQLTATKWSKLEQHPQCYTKVRAGRRLILVAYVENLLTADRGARGELMALSRTVEMTLSEPLHPRLCAYYSFKLDNYFGAWTVRTHMRDFFASVVARYEADSRTLKLAAAVKTPHVPWTPQDYTRSSSSQV